MAFSSHYSHWVSNQFVQVFLTSVSKYDFFSASVWSIQIKAIAVLWSTVSFKSMVFNGSNILSLTYKVKIDYLTCRLYFYNSDHMVACVQTITKL